MSRFQLGSHVFRSSDPSLVGAPHIALCTLCWADVSRDFVAYWTDLWGEIARGGKWATWTYGVESGSLLPIVRDKAVLDLYNRNVDFTHLIMIDSDVVGLRLTDIKRLVDHRVPIVAPIVCLKGGKFVPAVEPDDGYEAIYAEVKRLDPGLVERRWVGTGCICIEREVLDRMAMRVEMHDGRAARQWFRSGRQERVTWEREMQNVVESCVRRTADVLNNGDPATRPGRLAELFVEAWLAGRDIWNGGAITGEDVEFGTRARALGYKSYVDCGIKLDHIGSRAINVDDHLKAVGRTIQSATGIQRGPIHA